MNRDIKWYAGRNKEMIENDRARNDHFLKIDQMIELDYKLPKELSDLKHMRNIVSTDPLSAITTGRRTLATVKPTVFIQPINDHKDTKDLANKTEKILLWQLDQAAKRSRKDLIGDIVESSLRYDMTAVLTIPIEWQLKANLSKSTSRKRYNAATDFGAFMVTIENPKNIHARHSPLGLEIVLNSKVMKAVDVVTFYGDRAKELWKKIKDSKKELWVTVYDMWSYDKRVVYCTEPKDSMASPAEASDVGYVLIDTDINIPFLPWTIEEGGTSLATGIEHGYRGLLSPIAHTNMWETQNIARSLAFAEAIAYSAAPRAAIYTYAEDGITVDYGDINNPVYLKPGEEYKALNPPKIDENLLHVFDRTGADIAKLTGVKNLTDLDAPSGTAFATINAVIKAATSSLDPAKNLAEDTIGSVMKNMMYWSKHTGKALVGFGDGDEDRGELLERKSKHIDEGSIFIDVTLSPQVPTDRLQKINAASLLNKELQYSKVDAYRELGVPNPEDIIDRWRAEQVEDTKLRNFIKQQDAMVDIQIQSAARKSEMADAQAQQQAEQDAMSQNAPPPGQGPPSGQGGGGPVPGPNMQAKMQAQTEALQGSGFNPNGGGESPNNANPEGMLRELLLGQAKG